MRPLSESMVDPVRHIIQTGWLGYGNSGILLPMPLIFKIWKFIAPSWRAQRRWKFLRDYFKRLFILDTWLWHAFQSPSLDWDPENNFPSEPQSFYGRSQHNRSMRLENFYRTTFRQLQGDDWDGDWVDPVPAPEVPSLIRFSNFGQRRP